MLTWPLASIAVDAVIQAQREAGHPIDHPKSLYGFIASYFEHIGGYVRAGGTATQSRAQRQEPHRPKPAAMQAQGFGLGDRARLR